ncbi:MAG: type II toxin-antitoxin system HicB family antitoxin [Bacteroidales bacterium]|nr:type II toxin-antitoxin system HicB family antitoxin [Bacteroidales bacterium]MCF8402514.1 type II toxin-antitoxin system HicB family antitoxin [Bacteroidales bacterium]
MEYLIIFEKNKQGHYGAYVPDLPGCVSIGDTLEEAKQNIKAALELHLEGMKMEGYIIPNPSATADFVTV